jgi:hypothetical protein
VGFDKYLPKALVGRKMGVGRWVGMIVAHFKYIGEKVNG